MFNLILQILSGFQIPRAPRQDKVYRNVTDPFVELQIRGVRDDCTTRRTRVVHDNGLHPCTISAIDHYCANFSTVCILLVDYYEYIIAFR